MLASRIRGSVYRKKEQGGGIPSYYKMAQDSDFSGTKEKDFRYIGNGDYVIIPDTIKGVSITTTEYMFREYNKPQLKGVASLNPNLNSVQAMFYKAIIPTLELEYFDISNVSTFTNMLARITNQQLNTRGWKFKSNANLYGMFSTTTLNHLDLTHWDVSEVMSVSYCFRDAKAQSINISGWDLSNHRNVSMFMNCESPIINLKNVIANSYTTFMWAFRGVKTNELDLTGFSSRQCSNYSAAFMNAEIGNLIIPNLHNRYNSNMDDCFRGFKTDVLDASSLVFSNYDNYNLSGALQDAQINIMYVRSESNRNDLRRYGSGSHVNIVVK